MRNHERPTADWRLMDVRQFIHGRFPHVPHDLPSPGLFHLILNFAVWHTSDLNCQICPAGPASQGAFHITRSLTVKDMCSPFETSKQFLMQDSLRQASADHRPSRVRDVADTWSATAVCTIPCPGAFAAASRRRPVGSVAEVHRHC